MKLLIALVCLTAFVQLATAGERDAKGQLAGTVTDGMGAVIPNATVLIHWNLKACDESTGKGPRSSSDTRLRTDAAGRFATELSPGIYDVLVFAADFSPTVIEVRVRTGQIANLSTKLKVNQLFAAECADEFPADPAVPLVDIPPEKQ